VDEGNNWINIDWGPLTMVNPVTGNTLANYGPGGGSPVITYIPSNAANNAYTLAPSLDFFGNSRKTNGSVDAGAVEFVAPAGVNVLPTSLTFSAVVGTTSAAQTLTVYNNTTTPLTFTATSIAITAPFTRATAAQGGAGNCPAGAGTVLAGASCNINIVFNAPATPAGGSTSNGSATINPGVAVNGSPVSLIGNAVPATFLASVSPSPLDFGIWATGTTSGAKTLTVTNTGNSALAGGTFTFGGATPQVFSRPGGAAGGTCGAALAVGASCTINVVFAPTAATTGPVNRTLTVAYTNATVTPTPVNLTGTGVTTRASVSIVPNPLRITLPTGAANVTGTGTVTFTNTAPTGTGAQILVTAVAVAPVNLQYAFNVVAGSDTCTGTTLLPGASCTVGVRFTTLLAARGANRTGTITFTDSGAASPQVGNLIGFAQP
jgi:hypothetical protein